MTYDSGDFPGCFETAVTMSSMIEGLRGVLATNPDGWLG